MNTTNTKYYLGLDWGKSKIGLALADSEIKIASALKEIEAKDIESEIDNLKQEYNIEKVIIGTTNLAGGFSPENKQMIEILAEKIVDKGLIIEFEEEQFTTQLAQQNLAEKGAKEISKSDNAEAARIILQSWLDRSGC